MNKVLFALLAVTATSAFAQDAVSYKTTHHRFSLAPQGYYLHAHYATNTNQGGGMWGAKFSYDYTRDYLPYVGIEGQWAKGKLDGSWGNNMTQEFFGELRLGYRMAFGENRKFALTPFTGFGYYVFLQNYEPMPAWRYRFLYAPIGLRFDWRVNDFFATGLYSKFGAPYDSRWSQTQSHNGSTCYLVEFDVPLRFYIHPKKKCFDLSLVPFWRQYFIHSKGELIGQKNMSAGAQLEVGYNF